MSINLCINVNNLCINVNNLCIIYVPKAPVVNVTRGRETHIVLMFNRYFESPSSLGAKHRPMVN